MYLQEILEVAIGLVFAWLVISVATMSIQEWISNILNRRAKEMENAIAQMLNSKEMTDQFYKHPLITNLYVLPKKPGKKPRYPSYIPAQKFGAALFDLVIQAGSDNSPVQGMTATVNKLLPSIQSPEQQKLAGEDWNTILETAANVTTSGLGSDAFDSLKLQVQIYGNKYPELNPVVNALLPQMDTFYAQFVQGQSVTLEPGADRNLTMRQFRLGMLALQKINPQFTASVTAILHQAEIYSLRGEQAVAATRVNMENWFNDSMDRLSGVYKRKSELAAFIIGIVIALILNVDTIKIATSLWREPTLRQAIVAQAQDYVTATSSQSSGTSSTIESIPTLETQLQALNIPFGWAITSFATGSRQCAFFPLSPNQVWGIPSQDSQGLPICKRVSNLPVDVVGWLTMLLGLFMTGLAAAQGAPFWFDILRKLVNVRSTGANPSEKEAVG